jgi:3-oxoacyl-[acyl-carrier protein] reductase
MERMAAEQHIWIKPVYIDLSDEEQIKQGMQSIIKEKLPIDVLVNAAGIVSENRLIQMTTMQTMHDVMNVNFFAAVQVVQLASRVMCRQKSGSIINIASIAGLDGDYAQLEYAASKAALICATKKMAFEWGSFGIRVNAIAPGMTETKMIGGMDDKVTEDMIRHNTLGRKGTPQEVAQLVLYLASEESTYITAQTIRIDGGGTNFISTINR